MRALVTGGAGGIGRWIVTKLVEDGYRVTIADADEARNAEAREVTGAADAVTLDLTDEVGAVAAVEAARDGGDLHALVNCLGISPKADGRKRPFYDIGLKEWNRVMEVNLTAPFLVTKAAYPHLSRGDGAAIVNILSIMAKSGASGPEGTTFGPFSPSGAHYGASKAGLTNLTISVARELAPLGIRCNGVAPGFVGQGMKGSTDTGLSDRIVAQIPLGRSATEDEVAEVVRFLYSSKSSYLTGEVIDVDGGWLPD